MPRILVITQFFPPETFAGANRVGSMVAAFSRSHDVVVLTLQPSYPTPAAYGPTAAFDFDRRQAFRTRRRSRFVAHSRSLARRALREQLMALRLGYQGLTEPADVVISSTPSMFLGPVCLALARLKGSCFLWDIRDVGWEYAGESERSTPSLALPLAVLRRLMWWVAGHADVLVAATPGVAALVEEHIGRGRVSVVGNTVSAELLDACAACAEEVVKERPLVSYVGLIGDAQGLDVLVDVARELPSVDFVVVGDGPQRPALERLVGAKALRNLRLTGYLPRAGVLDVYRRSDVLFAQLRDTPTLNSTGLPSKLHEYMATGKPIVYAGRGLAARTLTEIGCARIAPPGSGDGIATAIRELLADPDMRRTMGVRGRSTVAAAGDREAAFSRLVAAVGDEATRHRTKRRFRTVPRRSTATRRARR